jgi:hypothetical protein
MEDGAEDDRFVKVPQRGAKARAHVEEAGEGLVVRLRRVLGYNLAACCSSQQKKEECTLGNRILPVEESALSLCKAG